MSNTRKARRGARDVVVAYLCPEQVDSRFMAAKDNLQLYDRDHGQRIAAIIGHEASPRLGPARCETVRTFLGQFDEPWMLWLDTDMTFEPSMLDDLLAVADPVKKPIVGALCFAGGRTKIVPTIYAIHHDDEGKLHSETILAYPEDQVIEVGGTGSACILIHRSVFERIAEMMGDHPLPWYQDVVIDGKDWGEDLVFCMRARGVGASTWIHTGVKTGHRKKWTMDQRAFVDYARQLDELADGPVTVSMDELRSISEKTMVTWRPE